MFENWSASQKKLDHAALGHKKLSYRSSNLKIMSLIKAFFLRIYDFFIFEGNKISLLVRYKQTLGV